MERVIRELKQITRLVSTEVAVEVGLNDLEEMYGWAGGSACTEATVACQRYRAIIFDQLMNEIIGNYDYLS